MNGVLFHDGWLMSHPRLHYSLVCNTVEETMLHACTAWNWPRGLATYLWLMHVAAVSVYVSRAVLRGRDVLPYIVHQPRQQFHDALFMTFDPRIGVPKIGAGGGNKCTGHVLTMLGLSILLQIWLHRIVIMCTHILLIKIQYSFGSVYFLGASINSQCNVLTAYVFPCRDVKAGGFFWVLHF